MITTINLCGVDDVVLLRPTPFLPYLVKSLCLKATASATTVRTRSTSAFHASGTFRRAGDEQKLGIGDSCVGKQNKRSRVFFLDVNHLCYHGTTPSLRAFGLQENGLKSEDSLSALGCVEMFMASSRQGRLESACK